MTGLLCARRVVPCAESTYNCGAGPTHSLQKAKTMQTTKKLYHSVKENLRPLLMRGKKLGRRAASQRRKPKKECVSEKIHLIFAKM